MVCHITAPAYEATSAISDGRDIFVSFTFSSLPSGTICVSQKVTMIASRASNVNQIKIMLIYGVEHYERFNLLGRLLSLAIFGVLVIHIRITLLPSELLLLLPPSSLVPKMPDSNTHCCSSKVRE
jgi:hypothetical protein